MEGGQKALRKTRILISCWAHLASFCSFGICTKRPCWCWEVTSRGNTKIRRENLLQFWWLKIEPGASSSNTQVKSWISDLIPWGAINNPESAMGQTVSVCYWSWHACVVSLICDLLPQISIYVNLVGPYYFSWREVRISCAQCWYKACSEWGHWFSLITCIASILVVVVRYTEGNFYTSSSVAWLISRTGSCCAFCICLEWNTPLYSSKSKINAQTYYNNFTLKKKSDLVDTTNQSSSSDASKDVQPENPASSTADKTVTVCYKQIFVYRSRRWRC